MNDGKVSAQDSSSGKREHMQKLRELIQDIQTASLVTMDADGVLHGRPMATQQLDENAELWFFTGDYSAKVDNVLVQPQVCVTYADPAKNTYVSVSGTAELVRDPAKIRELWKPAYKTWFPKGVEDPDLALLCVEVISAQYWDAASSKLVHLFGRIKALATGQGAVDGPGDNAKVTVRQRIGSDTAT